MSAQALPNGGQRFGHPAPSPVSIKPPPENILSTRELEISLLVAQGLSNKEIGRRLALSYHTVSTHLRRAFIKLGVNSRVELCHFLVRLRIFEINPSPVGAKPIRR